MVLQEFCTTTEELFAVITTLERRCPRSALWSGGKQAPISPADCVHGGLDQHRMSTSHIHQFGIAVVTDYSFNFDNPGKTHDACHLGIKGHYPVHDLPLALGRMIGSKNTARRERRGRYQSGDGSPSEIIGLKCA